ncbi:hypothetical protein [Bosea sp. LjRoot237]|uniref:hypothetical protein n=1 Tax=Bosea sp. LjRoot237 TaxID=3342292 RepID=UPI003ED09B91
MTIQRLVAARQPEEILVGAAIGLAMLFADTHAMQAHLDGIARTAAKGAHSVLLCDRAGSALLDCGPAILTTVQSILVPHIRAR